MKTLTATLVAITLAGCGKQSTKIENTADPSSPTSAGQIRPAPTPTASTTLSHAAVIHASATKAVAPKSRMQNCELRVDGKTLMEGPCLVFPMGAGFTLNTWDRGKPVQSHFAIVDTQDGEKGTATWNADPDDTRAADPLGEVRRQAHCWVNQRVRICAG